MVDKKPCSVGLCRCARDEFNPRGQLFFTPLIQAMRMIIHLGETVPETLNPDGSPTAVYRISAGTLLLWAVVVFALMLLTFGIGAASGVMHVCWYNPYALNYKLTQDAYGLLFWYLSKTPMQNYLQLYLTSSDIKQHSSSYVVADKARLQSCVVSTICGTARRGRSSVLATGIFIPSLAIGGAWGRVVGMIVQAALNSASSSLTVSLPAYAVRLPSLSLQFSRTPLPKHIA